MRAMCAHACVYTIIIISDKFGQFTKFFPFPFSFLILFSIFVAVSLIIESMSTRTMTKTIAEYFKTQPVVKAWLFGSYARGEQTPDSDVDIMVVLDSDAQVGLFQLSGMLLDLQDRLQKRVDLVTESGLLPFARESAEHDKKLIYERAS